MEFFQQRNPNHTHTHFSEYYLSHTNISQTTHPSNYGAYSILHHLTKSICLNMQSPDRRKMYLPLQIKHRVLSNQYNTNPIHLFFILNN